MVSRGFPDRTRWTPVPDVFFSRDLPAIDDPVALKVFLHVLWRIYRRPEGEPPALRSDELAADGVLRQGVRALGVGVGEGRVDDGGRDNVARDNGELHPDHPDESAVDRAIEAAVDRLVGLGLLIDMRLAAADRPQRWLMINGREGRGLRARLAEDPRLLPDRPPAEVLPAGPRPTIFALYEQNIGLLTPMLAEELREAEAAYPPAWIEDAIRRAVAHNARRWTYVRAILERWASEGRDEEREHATDRRRDQTARKRDSEGPYAAFVER